MAKPVIKAKAKVRKQEEGIQKTDGDTNAEIIQKLDLILAELQKKK
jgi:hypothetical protein